MSGKLRGKLTYANVIATLALFMALGGGAIAAVHLGRNSVGAKQIKKNAVSSSKVKDSSLLAKDFKPGQLPAGKDGDPGAPGAVRAYGFVSSAGALDVAQSKNLSVTKIASQPGAYCVRPAAGSGIDPTTELPVVAADLASGGGGVHTAQVSSQTYYPAACPSAEGWEIYTQIENIGGQLLEGDTGFSILVP